MNSAFHTVRGEVLIRPASLADAVQFRELRLHALQDSPLAFSADYQMNAMQPAAYWQDRMKEDEDASIFFAEYEQRLIGMTGIVRGRSPKTKHAADIWGVYLRPEWRGLHIAEALIHACFAWAKAREVVILRLGVTTVNQPAIRCYERCGFSPHGTEPRALFHEGKYYDFFLMSRSLDQ